MTVYGLEEHYNILGVPPEFDQGFPPEHDLYVGNSVAMMPNLPQSAERVSGLLLESPFLVKYTPIEITQFMLAGNSVVVQSKGDVIAHCKLDVHPGCEEYPPVVELGSVVVDSNHKGQGLGTWAVLYGIQLAQRKYPGIQNVAVVAQHNQPSIALFERLGGVQVPKPVNIPIKINTAKHCFDITNVHPASIRFR